MPGGNSGLEHIANLVYNIMDKGFKNYEGWDSVGTGSEVSSIKKQKISVGACLVSGSMAGDGILLPLKEK